jgi:D-glycero-D-manno-heptose 1,7-bisphosphate phosphatase
VSPAVFLDRDGVINVDHGYVSRPEQFEFIDGVFEACQHFAALGYTLIVVTNQSGIGRGYYSEADFHQLTDWMVQRFADHGVKIAGVYWCPHHPVKAQGSYQRECNCRKPAPGMILQAAAEHGIDLSRSLMLGDKAADMQAAASAGVGHKVLVLSGQPISAADQALADEVWLCARDALHRFRAPH